MKKQTINTATNTVVRISICVVSLLLNHTVSAQSTTHTQLKTFNDALAMDAVVTILDFELLSSGDMIASGTAIDGFEFNYDISGVLLRVGDSNTTASGTNYLGTTDADLLQDVDDFNVVVDPSSAFGITIVTADIMVDDDISVTFNGVTVSLVALDVQQTLSDGSFVYFLGVTSDTQTDTTAIITTLGDGVFLYNVDDIVRAEDAACLLGDVDLNGTVNLLDVDPFIATLSTGTYQCEADCNKDGAVNLLDVDFFIAIFGGG